MEEKAVWDQFDDIEKRVGQLIEICQTLESENTNLRSRVEQLEKELQATVEAESRHQAERQTIRTRIDALLAKLEGFADPPR